MLLTHLFFSENRSSKPKFTRSETGKPCSFILLGKTGILKFQGCKSKLINESIDIGDLNFFDDNDDDGDY